jgi:hypothetical protein
MAVSYSLKGLPQVRFPQVNLFETSAAVSPSGNSLTTINNGVTESLQFVYGVPYEIGSTLTLDVCNILLFQGCK